MKKLVSLVLALVLCFSLACVAGAAEAEVYAKVTDGNLTSGKYILVDAGGYAPAYLDGSWVLACQPTIAEDKISAPSEGVWTLTVDGTSVKLTDANGKSIAPKGGNTNGIIEGDYAWTYTYADGTFTFSGNGEDTVSLAANVGSDNKYRAYKNATIEGQGQEKYPSLFTLYKLEEPKTDVPDFGDMTLAVVAAMVVSGAAIVVLNKKREF